MVGETQTPLLFNFDNQFAREMVGFYELSAPERAPAPRLIRFNHALAAELGANPEALEARWLADWFSGAEPLVGAEPLAQAYAGHQFGGFSPRLGDGRAVLLGEVLDVQGRRFDIQLKGSGVTPFSRGGDGKAALGPVLREYLVAEAMHSLGVATTRALAAVTTGEMVYRERRLPGAVVTRVAASHLRVGTFQYFAARGEVDDIRKLADYAIARHYPVLASENNPYLSFLSAVCSSQASLVASWVSLGFIHGVMNTDNMTISGETIDYGPCAFMDAYDPDTVFSSIDRNGRYAFANQPMIAQWNLARLAETLLPFIDSDTSRAIEEATRVINGFGDEYAEVWLGLMRKKLGLLTAQEGDLAFVNEFLSLLTRLKMDYTGTFRRLSNGLRHPGSIQDRVFSGDVAGTAWIEQWRQRLQAETLPEAEIAEEMDSVNPLYIPRNHLVEEMIEAAVERSDFAPFEALLQVLSKPFAEQPGLDRYACPAPEKFGAYVTFCGT